MPHSTTLWQTSDAFDTSGSNNNTATHFRNNLPTPGDSPPDAGDVKQSEHIHKAGRCSCVQEDNTELGNYRRRQSQQSRLARYVMSSNLRQTEEMRRSDSDEGANPEDVSQLRDQLVRSLSPDIEKKQHGVSHQQFEQAMGSMAPPDKPAPAPVPPRGSAMAKALAGEIDGGSQAGKGGASIAQSDTPAGTVPPTPRIPPVRQLSGGVTPGIATPRVRPTTLDIPGLTKSKVSPDGRIAQRDVGAKLVIVMVGLPARGKSYITKKLARYLNWLQHDTRIFNVGERRRVAAGGPNTLEKTPSQTAREVHRASVAAVPTGIVDQEELSKTRSHDLPQRAASVAQIVLNDSTKVEAPSTPKEEVTRLPPPPGMTRTTTKERKEYQEKKEIEELEKKFPELAEAQAQMEDAPPAVEPETEHMEQSASFFDPKNKKAALVREQVAMETLDELLDYVLDQNGSIGIFDATNSTLERRKMIMRRIRERAGPDLNVLFLESRCEDKDLLEGNMRLKLNGPDYKGMDPDVALEDFKQRIAVYETAYVPLGEYEEKNNMPYIQMIDVGRKVVSHQVRGFLSAQTNYYLLNFNLAPRQIWITRHGLSQDNVSGKIGGDSDLADEGVKYAQCLARFMDEQRVKWETRQLESARNTHFPPQPGDATPPNPYFQPQSNDGDASSTNGTDEGPVFEGKPFCVWTSMLKRSIQTAKFFDEEMYDIKQMRMLDELNAGVMEGLTYNCISAQYPDEYSSRKKNKLQYRYPGPGGEGYLDIINRLRPVIVELERMTDHVLLVGHRSVARVLLAYFRGLPREAVADLDVPIGMLYCLEPKPYGVDFVAYRWNKTQDGFEEVPDFELKAAQDDMQ